MKDILILAIESSCDETAAAVVLNGKTVLSNIISSQIKIHEEFGGVVPEIASRKHTEAIVWVVDKALSEAGVGLSDLNGIAVTYGPGLVGALLVGVSYAKSLAYSLSIPLIPVHHIEGHIAANYIEHKELQPPFVCIVASGGHSHIVYADGYLHFEILGRTRDDAAGEAFDKIARVLELGYPGGPAIEKTARLGSSYIEFPKVYFKDSFDFSFSGIKTSVINYIHKAVQKGEEINKANIAASFQMAVVEVLVKNTVAVAVLKGVDKVCMAGGVASNAYFRQKLKGACDKQNLMLYCPSGILCTDNAAMIGCAGYFEYLSGKRANLYLNAKPSLKLGES